MAIRFLNSQSIDGELTVTGNVGIGTTSPNSRLEVSDTFPVLRLTNESSTSTIGDVVSSIEFYNSDTSGNYPAVGAAIKSINESAFGNANALGFFTNSDSASESEHMRINSSGNVGIGTTSPLLSYGGKGLQIQNTDTAGLRLTDTTGADFDISARSGDVLLYEGEGNPIRIGVGGSEKMRIQNDGYVGIGTTTPGYLLDVQAVTDPSIRVRSSGTGSSDDALVRIRVGGTTASSIVAFGDSSSSTRGQIKYTHSVDAMRLYTAGAEQVRIDSNGDVGIGSTNPIAKLYVDGGILGGTAGDEVALLSLKTTNNNTDTLQFTSERLTTGTDWTHAAQRIQRKIDTTLMGYMQFGSMNDDLITFGEGNTERMRIDGDGNVGIGNASPENILHVEKANPIIFVQDTDTSLSTTEAYIKFSGSQSSAAGGGFRTDIEKAIGYKEDSLVFEDGGTERMRIDSSGNVGIGTTSPNSELHIASGNPVLTLQDTNSNDPNAVKIEFTDQINDVHAEIGLTAGNSGALNIKNNYKAIDFYTGTSGTSTLAMQIDDNGFVGIGITNPTATLHVNGGLRVSTVNEATTYSADKFLVSDAENVKYVDAVQLASLIDPYVTGGGKFVDGTDTNDAVYTTGNVGIGTTSPDSLLHISQGVNSTATNLIIENTDTSILDTEDLAKIEFKSNDASTGGVGVAASIRTVAESAGTLYGVGFNTKAGTAETEKMRITAYGNVGIGIVTPNDKLEVVGAINAKAGFGFKLGNSNETAIGKWYNTSGVNYLEGDASRSFQIGSVTNGVNVRFDNVNNRVGIGTTSPTTELNVKGDITITNANGTNPTDAGNLYFAESGTSWGSSIYGFRINLQGVNNTLNFQSASTTTVRDIITLTRDTAYVGIGTTSPSTLLEIASGNSGGDAALDSPTFRINNTTDSADWDVDDVVGSIEYYSSDPGGNAPYVTSFIKSVNENDSGTLPSGALTFGTAAYNAIGGAIERLRITDDGDVGIGITIPDQRLDVQDTTSTSIRVKSTGTTATDNAFLRLEIGGTTATNAIAFGSASNAFQGQIRYVHQTNYMSFHGNGNLERMRIDSSGNVGIGTTSPSSTLSVNGVYTGEYPVDSGLNNVVMGVSNAGSITTGVENFIVGQGNLTLATSINRSTVSGQDNAKSVSSSSYNTFFGYGNMYSNTGATSYNFMAGYNNLYSSIGAITDNVIIGRENGYTAALVANNATLLGRENGYNASSVGSCTLIGWRNCYDNTNALNQNNIIGYGNLYHVDNAIVYNSVMGYQNAYNATDVDYCSLFGFRNAFDAGNLDYTTLFGRDNGYNSSSITYTIMSGYGNATNVASTIKESALFGRQNAENGDDIQYSILSGGDNAKEANFIRYSSVFGKDNALNANQVQYSLVSGQSNAYTTTDTINYSMLVGYRNGYAATVSLDNTILLGFEQGYSVGSQGAADYRLAIGMYRDNPLIYGEFDSEVLKINGSLTVTDRTGAAATKSAFFDSTGQLIEGDPASTISFAISDETSDLTVGQGKLVFRMPYAMTITDVRASVTTPPTGSTIIVDIEQGGSSIFTTNLLSIDAGEKTSTTAATPPNITTTALNDDVEIIVNIDQVGSTVAGTGLKVYLIGTRA